MTSWNERNKVVIEEFRANGGRVKGWAPLILLTTTGAKTGQPRVAPLMQVTDGDHLLAVASKGGAPKHPDWYLNLLAHPEVTVEVGSEKFTATARVLSGDERERAFKRAVEVYPPYGRYQEKTTREIPVIALEWPAT
ncbi:MAG TPA: nitroreductase family deazaflavin-dependent oxidoreductase [Ktedonobacteraceae bacterium]